MRVRLQRRELGAHALALLRLCGHQVEHPRAERCRRLVACGEQDVEVREDLLVAERVPLFIPGMHDHPQHVVRLLLGGRGPAGRDERAQQRGHLAARAGHLLLDLLPGPLPTVEGVQQDVEQVAEPIDLGPGVKARERRRGHVKRDLPRFAVDVHLAALDPRSGALRNHALHDRQVGRHAGAREREPLRPAPCGTNGARLCGAASAPHAVRAV